MNAAVRRRLRRAAARATTFAAERAARGGLRILTYHRVNDRHPADRLSVHPREFAAQMERLAATCRVVPLGSALAALRDGRAPGPGTVCLTFDDGYRDNHACALPVLERLRLPATFFIATAYTGTDQTIDRYRGCCAHDRMMGWDEVRDLIARGHEVGGHGRRHLELAGLGEAEARDEIHGSRDDIASGAGVRPRVFCYPRGSEDARVRRAVAAAGFEAACTVEPGANAPGVDLFGLRRTEVSSADDLADFALKIRGGFDGWHRLVQGARARSHA
jgi:peptidoglycan/xylan/chitin deacetylase (PgdA/CDA1 family)